MGNFHVLKKKMKETEDMLIPKWGDILSAVVVFLSS